MGLLSLLGLGFLVFGFRVPVSRFSVQGVGFGAEG